MPDLPFASEVIREMRSRPYTMVVILLLTLAVPYVWQTDARASDVAELKQEVAHIDAALLEAKLRAISSELFDIQQKVSEKQQAHQVVDQIYLDRISSLLSDKAQAERDLAIAMKR